MLTYTTTVQEVLGKGAAACQSPSLRLDRFVDLRIKGRDGSDGSNLPECEAICKCANAHRKIPPLTHYFLDPERTDVRTFALRLGGRLILNQNSGLIENAGLLLHHHYGCPYLPGTTLKGLARVGAALSPDERVVVNALFGPDEHEARGPRASTFRQGLVAFLPAFPTDPCTLVTDLVNCHHPAYYQGKREAAWDDENPIPNFFPAVEAGVHFLFQVVLLPRAHRQHDDAYCQALLAVAEKWLKAGLTDHGVGAKTAAGYGWFQEDDSEQQLVLQRMHREFHPPAPVVAPPPPVEDPAVIAKQQAEYEQRRLDEYCRRQKFTADDKNGELMAQLRKIKDLPPDEQRFLCLTLRGLCTEVWKRLCTKADKGKGDAPQLVSTLRELAHQQGIDLP